MYLLKAKERDTTKPGFFARFHRRFEAGFERLRLSYQLLLATAVHSRTIFIPTFLAVCQDGIRRHSARAAAANDPSDTARSAHPQKAQTSLHPYFLPADMVTQVLNFGVPAPIDIQNRRSGCRWQSPGG
jgi:hypothetical protein